MKFRALCLVAFILVTACMPTAPVVSVTPTSGELTPYYTKTPTIRPVVNLDTTSTPLPSPTPTPRSYTVKLGDTFGTIAFNHDVTVDALIVANPGVDPNIIIVGTVLVIPPTQADASTGDLSPTPVVVALSAPVCWPTSQNGLWCFAEFTNNQTFAVESVSAVFRISDTEGQKVRTVVAACPLNVIPPGLKIAVGGYFDPPVPDEILSSVELNAALPLENPMERYLPVNLDNQSVAINASGLAAVVSGEVILQDEVAAREIWVLAVARNAEGTIVGFRRWEWQGDETRTIPYSFQVYSLGDPIENVQVFAEARP